MESRGGEGAAVGSRWRRWLRPVAITVIAAASLAATGPTSAAMAVQSSPADAEVVSRWPLSGGTDDVVGDNHLLLSGEEDTGYQWIEDRACRPERSLWLDGSGEAYARTTGPMVSTDESFSLVAWVKVDTLTGEYQTVMSQGGFFRQAVQLGVTPDARWQFAVPHRNPWKAMAGVAQTEAGSVEPEVWHHLAGVVDLEAGEIRLYLNGEHVSTASVPTWTRHAAGPFYLGVGGNAFGSTIHPLSGTVDAVEVWSSTLTSQQIAQMGSTGGLILIPCF